MSRVKHDSYNTYNYNNSSTQYNGSQIQKQQQKQMSLQQFEIKQRLYEDISNVIGMLVEYKALKNHPTCPKDLQNVFYNRCALQFNLSNLINVDDSQTSDQNGNANEYKKMKSEAKITFNKILQSLQPQIDLTNDEEISHILTKYVSINLDNKPNLQQMNQKSVNYTPQFNQETVQKIFNATAEKDMQKQKFIEKYNNNQLDSNKEIINEQQIIDKSLQRYQNAQQRIEVNYPKDIKQQKRSDKKGESVNRNNENYQKQQQMEEELQLQQQIDWNKFLPDFQAFLGAIHTYFTSTTNDIATCISYDILVIHNCIHCYHMDKRIIQSQLLQETRNNNNKEWNQLIQMISSFFLKKYEQLNLNKVLDQFKSKYQNQFEECQNFFKQYMKDILINTQKIITNGIEKLKNKQLKLEDFSLEQRVRVQQFLWTYGWEESQTNYFIKNLTAKELMISYQNTKELTNFLRDSEKRMEIY